MKKNTGDLTHKYKKPIDVLYLIANQPREVYVQVYKNLGFIDICTCEKFMDVKPSDRLSRTKTWRMQENVHDRIGIKICVECQHRVFPLATVYPCDDCTEPTEADYILLKTDEIYCPDCADY